MFSIWTVAIKALCWLGPLTVAALNQVRCVPPPRPLLTTPARR